MRYLLIFLPLLAIAETLQQYLDAHPGEDRWKLERQYVEEHTVTVTSTNRIVTTNAVPQAVRDAASLLQAGLMQYPELLAQIQTLTFSQIEEYMLSHPAPDDPDASPALMKERWAAVAPYCPDGLTSFPWSGERVTTQEVVTVSTEVVP